MRSKILIYRDYGLRGRQFSLRGTGVLFSGKGDIGRFYGCRRELFARMMKLI